jgi:peptide/nickel transport system substrate-binding protein
MHNLAQPQYSTVVPTNPYYNGDVPRYDYDPDKAKALLKDAGYTPGSDGNMQKDGKPLRLKLIYGPNSSKTLEKIAIVLQSELKKIGVQVDIQSYEWGAFLDVQKKPPFDWDLSVGAWAGTIEPYWMSQIWSEKFIPDLNAVGYVNKKVEDLFKQSGTECGPSRKALFNQIQQILAEDSPYIFMFQNKSFSAVNKRVKNIQPSPLGISTNIEQWDIQE